MEYGVLVDLDTPDAFLLIKESLTRIGVASSKTKTLYQTCHILHKRGRYYILMFKELFALDGKMNNISKEDIERRNLIASLLQDWKLLRIVDQNQIAEKASMNSIKILAYTDKQTWRLESKYSVGSKK